MRGESQAEWFHIQYPSCQFIIFTGSESEREKKEVTTVGEREGSTIPGSWSSSRRIWRVLNTAWDRRAQQNSTQGV